MARLVITTIATVALLATEPQQALAQQKIPATGEAAKKKYSLKVDFPQNVASSYALTEKTTVQRDYRDNQKKNYQREVSYYFTMGKIGETEDGLTRVLCNLDSLNYSFTQGETTLNYNSQNSRASNVKGDFADLVYAQSILNHQFVLLMDKKNMVVGVTGKGEPNDIEWLRNYILVEVADIMDTAQKFLWLDGISDNRVTTLTDLNRGLIRERMTVAEDSSWSRPAILRLDGIEFSDTLTAKVTGLSRGVVSIECTSSGLKANTAREQRFFGIPAPATIESTVSGSGKTKLKVNQQGSIRGYEADYSAVIKGRHKNENFVQSITTSVRCSILNQFGW